MPRLLELTRGLAALLGAAPRKADRHFEALIHLWASLRKKEGGHADEYQFNYFFQSLLWWGLFLIALPAPWGWTAVIAPAAMLHFLLNVTGIPLTEKLSIEKRGDVYRDYQRTTSAFVPRFKKS